MWLVCSCRAADCMLRALGQSMKQPLWPNCLWFRNAQIVGPVSPLSWWIFLLFIINRSSMYPYELYFGYDWCRLLYYAIVCYMPSSSNVTYPRLLRSIIQLILHSAFSFHSYAMLCHILFASYIPSPTPSSHNYWLWWHFFAQMIRCFEWYCNVVP